MLSGLVLCCGLLKSAFVTVLINNIKTGAEGTDTSGGPPGVQGLAFVGRAGPRGSAVRTDLQNPCETEKDRPPWSDPEGFSGKQTSKYSENEWLQGSPGAL